MERKMRSKSDRCEQCGAAMYVTEPFERWHEPGSSACLARSSAAVIDANDLATVTSPIEKQGLALIGIKTRYIATGEHRGRSLVVPRWILAVYRTFAMELEPVYNQRRSEDWRRVNQDPGAAPPFLRHNVETFEKILDWIGEDEELKRAIVAADILDESTDHAAVRMVIDKWTEDRRKEQERGHNGRSSKPRRRSRA